MRTLQDPDTFRDLLYAVVTGQRNNEDSKRKAIASQAGTIFAGVFFPTTVLPGPLDAATRLIPAYYGLDGIRSVLLNHGGIADITVDLIARYIQGKLGS